MVVSTRGIVATSQTLASQAGAQILARGGSAADAAIAANAVLTVVEPMMNGMGGDLFAIVQDAKSGKLDGLNASGWAPEKLTPEFLRGRGEKAMPQFGIHSVTVPGCVEGWEKLHKKYGRLPWKDLFAPAIYYASHGFPLTEAIQEDWAASAANISGIFLPGGKAPALGQVFRNEELAAALKLVAEKGADAFYRGPIGAAIVKTSTRLGGTMSAADLADFHAEWVRPISTDYRGWTVYELPPNGQGMAALEMLNIMERFPLQRMDHASADALHHKIESQKLAYMDLQRYLGDPKFANVPWTGLISKEYAAERAKLVRARAASDVAPGTPPPSRGDTIYLSVVDRDGNIVSLIQSIYLAWGSRVAVDGMGFHLHNRAALFVLDEKHPNVLAGRKRPLHTIIPALMEKDNVHIGFGIMGGFNQAQAHAQFVSNVVDHAMNIQQALEAPRFTRPEFKSPGVVIENRYPAATLKALRAKGHRLDVVGAYSSQVGGGQAVIFDAKTGTKFGASSPRKDGAAVPEPDPYF
jgi:gamma-glutamyltranspeptidase/glutathione hydrolase